MDDLWTRRNLTRMNDNSKQVYYYVVLCFSKLKLQTSFIFEWNYADFNTTTVYNNLC